MRNSPFWWVFIAFMLLLDLYAFQAIKTVAFGYGKITRNVITIVYWVLSLSAIILITILPRLHFALQEKLTRSIIFSIIVGIFLAKFIICLFLLLDDFRRAITWIGSLFTQKQVANTSEMSDDHLSRSTFLSWLGLAAGVGLFGTLIYGFGNKYNYQLKKVKLAFPNLPKTFKGLKIIHISDIHSGSFSDYKAVEKGVEKILAQKPDIIFFTGDLVNNEAKEMDNFTALFSRLKAPMGVFSTLGNHDYGDYKNWESIDEKKANLDSLKGVHAQMGWRLLMNEHVTIEKDEEKIAILGIENWSAKARFPKYGNMQAAHAGTHVYPFKILLSHDPSHWQAEVLQKYTDVDLMLSGHTHGMQFGVDIPGLKWSPVQYVYKQWAGLYENANQKLYINRGFGFIGYPGRVGILPEITLIELS